MVFMVTISQRNILPISSAPKTEALISAVALVSGVYLEDHPLSHPVRR